MEGAEKLFQQFLDAQLQRTAARGPRASRLMSTGTVQKYAKVVSEVFRYAVRLGFLKVSPMANVERVKVKTAKPRILRLHELRAILAACPTEHRSFITVLALTGLCKSELFRMRWDWVDFDEKRLLIKEAKTGYQKLPLSPRVAEALKGLGPGVDELVFPGHYRDKSGDERIDVKNKSASNKRVAIRAARDAAKVDPSGVAFHTFRRSLMTLLDSLPGVSWGVVRALARHTDTSADMTTRYVHPSEDELRAAQAAVEGLLFVPSNVIELKAMGR